MICLSLTNSPLNTSSIFPQCTISIDDVRIIAVFLLVRGEDNALKFFVLGLEVI